MYARGIAELQNDEMLVYAGGTPDEPPPGVAGRGDTPASGVKPFSSTSKTIQKMIAKSEPLSNFVAQYRESGLDVGVFPTQAGNRYALRVVDPDEPQTGLTFLAAFSSNLREADRPSDKKKQVTASKALDDMLHDDKAMARYSACTCVIDRDSIKQFPDKYTDEDFGKMFIIISAAGTAVSDSYQEVVEEKKRGSVRGK